MIITAFTPTGGGNPNSPLFFSSGRGENWSSKFDIPGGKPLDQSPCCAKTSNELYIGTLRGNNQDLNVLHAADPFIRHCPVMAYTSCKVSWPDGP